MRLAAVLAALVVAVPAYAATRPPARVQVGASEFELVLSRRTVKQGRAIVQLVNLGEDPHDLALRRIAKGARTYKTREVLPGGVANLSLRLYPGRYHVWCTVGDHRVHGMHAILTVTR